jgi:hypothetical protein
MTGVHAKAAAVLLDLAADEFSNHGCNDWSFPDDWTATERQTFYDGYYAYVDDPEIPKDPRFMQDWLVMRYLVHLLKQETAIYKNPNCTINPGRPATSPADTIKVDIRIDLWYNLSVREDGYRGLGTR